MKTMGVNITTIAFLRILIIEIGSAIILTVVDAQGMYIVFQGQRCKVCPHIFGSLLKGFF